MSEKYPFDTSIPTSSEEQQKRARALAIANTFAGASAFALAILAIFALVGIVVILFVYEFGKMDLRLFVILLGSFAGGTVAFALAAFFLMRLSGRIEKRRLDFLERCDSPESFFVGEGTLATFTPSGILLHAEKGPSVEVPYRDIRFFSICSRKRAREEGEWSVVIEVPASYLAKDKMGAEKSAALIQTEAKPRLAEAIAAHDLTLLGEQRPEGPLPKKRFTAKRMFFLPDAKLKRRAVFLCAGGAVLAVAGIGVAFWEIWAGVILCFFGLLLLARSIFSLVRSRGVLAFYEEGIYWTAAGRTDSLFLKWEEIESLSRGEREGFGLIAAKCAYGEYHFPCPRGVWEFLQETFPGKLR